jgi:hypothetical protein
MIQQTARQAGHLDIMREEIDGRAPATVQNCPARPIQNEPSAP